LISARLIQNSLSGRILSNRAHHLTLTAMKTREMLASILTSTFSNAFVVVITAPQSE